MTPTLVTAAAVIVAAVIAGLFQMNSTNRAARRQTAADVAAQNAILSGKPGDSGDTGLAGQLVDVKTELQRVRAELDECSGSVVTLKAVEDEVRATIEARDATIRARDATIAGRDATIRRQQGDAEENRRQMEQWMDLLVLRNPGLLKADRPPEAETR